jgi:hypothetical protein
MARESDQSDPDHERVQERANERRPLDELDDQ